MPATCRNFSVALQPIHGVAIIAKQTAAKNAKVMHAVPV